MTERGLVPAVCPRCGAVSAEASALSCRASETDEAGLCEVHCPICDRVLLIPIAPDEIGSLLLLGARAAGRLPLELLEAHTGPAVSWDEVLDLHCELEGDPFPQRELDPGRAA